MSAKNHHGLIVEVHFTENEYQRTYEVVKELRKQGHTRLTVPKFIEQLTKKEVDKFLVQFHRESIPEPDLV